MRAHGSKFAANIGFKRNFERALSLCKGELIAPCDQDDIWLTDKLERMQATLQDKLLVYCDSSLMDANGNDLGRALSDIWHMRNTADPAAFVMENNVSGHALLLRRELLQRALPIPEGFFNDWWLAAVAASTDGMTYCPHAFVRYRQHAANVTKKDDRAPQSAGHGLKKLQEIGQRIEHLTALPGPSQMLLKQLSELWAARDRQWLSIGLSVWLMQHYELVFGLKKRSPSYRWRMPLKYLWGMRLKRLLGGRKYRV